MKGLIDHIQKSIFSPEYYEELLSRPASYSWKYYWSFTMLLAVLMTIITSLPMVPEANRLLREIPTSFVAYYPDDLEVRVDSGRVSSNITEPYFLALPRALEGVFASTSGVLHLVVIDTKTPVTLEAFRSYASLFWVSERSLAFMDEGGTMRVSSISPQTSFVVNESTVRGFVTQVEPSFHYVAPIGVIVIFVFFLFRFLFVLMYLLLAAFFVFLSGRAMGRKWGYGTSYRIALHAVTFPLLFAEIYALVPLTMIRLPFLFTLVLLLVVYVNYRSPVVVHEAPGPTD